MLLSAKMDAEGMTVGGVERGVVLLGGWGMQKMHNEYKQQNYFYKNWSR